VIRRQAEALGITPEEVEKRWSGMNLIRRIVTAEEIADVVAFLASPRSVAINGDAIAAGGGAPGPIYY
jgi:enoyl-[acyl-carrier-protein] reductase (NADH)